MVLSYGSPVLLLGVEPSSSAGADQHRDLSVMHSHLRLAVPLVSTVGAREGDRHGSLYTDLSGLLLLSSLPKRTGDYHLDTIWSGTWL